MSADRFEISDHGSKLTVRDTKYGSEVSMLRVRSYSRELTVMAGAIRQQARDLDQLRIDLAAAVAERDSALTEIERLNQWFESELIESPESSSAWRQRAEQAEARLAAIDAAPTVAVVSECAAGLYVHQKLFGAQLAEPGAELIYRPTKDQT